MEKIASFTIDHDILTPGLYLSRVDGDITTYDLRFVKPNVPPYLPNPVMHTIEHLFATLARNEAGLKERVIYFGPMGCRTGFYFLVRDSHHEEVIDFVRRAMQQIAQWEGIIPGAEYSWECGNYKEHDLAEARTWAAAYAQVLAEWTVDRLTYPKAERVRS